MPHTKSRSAGRETGSAPPVIAVCGVKNSGKTTLLAGIIHSLNQKGYRAAVIKHDGHDFTCDIPGTDSFRLHEAGAYGTAVFSASRIFIHKEIPGTAARDLIPLFPEADIIFVEGMKDSTLPKIEVVRRPVSGAAVSNPEGRFLIATDWEPEHFREPSAGLDDIEGIVGRILSYAGI